MFFYFIQVQDRGCFWGWMRRGYIFVFEEVLAKNNSNKSMDNVKSINQCFYLIEPFSKNFVTLEPPIFSHSLLWFKISGIIPIGGLRLT